MRFGQIDIPEEIANLIEKREKARKAKNWAQSDTLRNIIKEKGYILEDKSEGVKVTKA